MPRRRMRPTARHTPLPPRAAGRGAPGGSDSGGDDGGARRAAQPAAKRCSEQDTLLALLSLQLGWCACACARAGACSPCARLHEATAPHARRAPALLDACAPPPPLAPSPAPYQRPTPPTTPRTARGLWLMPHSFAALGWLPGLALTTGLAAAAAWSGRLYTRLYAAAPGAGARGGGLWA